MHPTDRPPWFPSIDAAQPDGLLMLGGQLTPNWLLAAYRRGIFPWPIVDGHRELLAWFCPDPRAVLEPSGLHVSRRLDRRLRRGEFRVTSDRAFREVIRRCAEPRRHEPLTWITPRLRTAYIELHESGYAHSVEVWHERTLVGGIYGVSIGGYFAGESMFHHARDASKAALVHLVRHLDRRGFRLIDVQQSTPHLVRLGATLLPRAEFLRRLDEAIQLPVSFGSIEPPAAR